MGVGAGSPSAGPCVAVSTRQELSNIQSAAEAEYFRSSTVRNTIPSAKRNGSSGSLPDRHGGTFVDVGANDYKANSKTYYLEKVLGWSGIAVDPQREFAAGYAGHRPHTKFSSFFGVECFRHDGEALHGPRQLARGLRLTAPSPAVWNHVSEVRDVPTISLTRPAGPRTGARPRFP